MDDLRYDRSPQLSPYEYIIWEGRPSPGVSHFTRVDIELIPLSIIWVVATVLLTCALLPNLSAIEADIVVSVLWGIALIALSNQSASVWPSLKMIPIKAELRMHSKIGKNRRIALAEPVDAGPKFNWSGKPSFGKAPIGLWFGQPRGFLFELIKDAEKVVVKMRAIQQGMA